MRDPCNRSIRSNKHPTLFVSVGCALLFIFLSSCSSYIPVQREALQAADDALLTQYSIVFVIHGDGDYLYHDINGKEYKADEVTLAEAKMVGEQNPNAEVFIFHQKPRKQFLFVFPRHDGEFYYYRNGRLIANEMYWSDQKQARFNPESDLYRRFRTDNQSKMVNMLLYFGHQIPEFGGAGYDDSFPNRTFTVHDFASGLKGFMNASSRFDIVVLSTCFGGTPYTIKTLGLHARYIVASPENLHLSYFDLHSLNRLDINLHDGDVHSFAKKFAYQSFYRLTNDIQTSVSVAVYDVDRVQKFLGTVHGMYTISLHAMGEETQSLIEHCDCADLPAYVLPTMNEGVEIFYRPALFGRAKNKQNHSGWECIREKEIQTITSQNTESVLKKIE